MATSVETAEREDFSDDKKSDTGEAKISFFVIALEKSRKVRHAFHSFCSESTPCEWSL